jgi:hypothetical protein
MNKIVKTASLFTSGIIVGALVKKFAFQGVFSNKKSIPETIKSVKNVFDKSNISEDVNNYFI